MSFIWPAALVSLLAVPALVAAYLYLFRERQSRRASMGTMGVLVAAGDSTTTVKGSRRRAGPLQHLPYAMFGLALLALAVGAARPQFDVDLPRRTGTVVLVFDTSASMLATDLEPTRLDGAKEAAKTFVADQPGTIEIAVVSFGQGGFVTQEPTNITEDVVSAIDRLAPEGGTSLGAGLFAALDLIVDEDLPVPESDLDGDGEPDNPLADPTDLELGFYGSSTIIVFTDGEDTSEIDPTEVAALASAAGVKVNTVGLGTAVGTVVEVDGISQATALDEATLTEIAELTGGVYLGSDGEGDLGQVYDKVDLRLEVEGEKEEVTAIAAGLGVILLAIGAVFSMFWFGRVP